MEVIPTFISSKQTLLPTSVVNFFENLSVLMFFHLFACQFLSIGATNFHAHFYANSYLIVEKIDYIPC